MVPSGFQRSNVVPHSSDTLSHKGMLGTSQSKASSIAGRLVPANRLEGVI